MNDSHDHSIAAEVGRHVLAFAGTVQPLVEATLRIKLTSTRDSGPALEYFTVVAKTSRGIVLSKQVTLWEEDFVDGTFPTPLGQRFLTSCGANKWRHVGSDVIEGELDPWGHQQQDSPYVTLQHDVQVLAPTVANSAAVARWFEALVATMRDCKPSQPHTLSWARTHKFDAQHASRPINAVSLRYGAAGGFFGEQTVQIAGGLYCEPLLAPSSAPASGHNRGAGAAAARAAQQFAYEDEPLPSAWTPEQCVAFDARCAGYHARTARIGARVAQLVGAWHAVPMTLG
jgi:hypothetical protein